MAKKMQQQKRKFKLNKFTMTNSSEIDGKMVYRFIQRYICVESIETKDELYTFQSNEDVNLRETYKTGILDVRISKDEKELITTDVNGGVTKYPLPQSVEYYDNGRKIKINWNKKKQEIRERKYTSNQLKWTDPIETLLNYPAEYFGVSSAKVAKTKRK